ncbi:hypothetical protein G9A89_019708 [Geosiphon pyriformis]|nr:hypothetical protein G9A89_019708 [Geosiphon pyriformis]
MVVHQLIPNSMAQLSGSRQWNLGTGNSQNPNVQHYLSLLVTSEDASSNNLETNQKKQSLINNIFPATITNDELLTAIFLFELEETTPVLLFSGATLDTKQITAMYTDAKVDGHTIKLILDSGSAGCRVDCTASVHIITADRATKTPIGEIDNFPFEVNGIIILIKVLVIEAIQYQALVGNDWLSKTNAILDWTIQELQLSQNVRKRRKKTYLGSLSKTNNNLNKLPIWEWEETDKGKGKKKEEDITKGTITTEEITSGWEREYSQELIKEPSYIPLKYKDCEKKLSSMGAWTKKCGTTFLDEEECVSCGTPITVTWHHAIFCLDSYPHDENKIWQMANTKVEGAMPSKILEIKNNSPKTVNIVLISNPDAFLNLKAGPEKFYEHYQNLAPTRGKQEQHLVQINTRLCDHCLIPCDFQYCNECDFIYNPPLCMIYTIPKEEPISSCTSKSESTFNSNSNSDNNDNKNNGSSSTQYGNEDNNNLNFDSNPETYIALPDLTKEQKLKWFSDNNEDIMPKHTHDTNTEFNLKYLRKNLIKLEPYLHTCIDLKITLEISVTTMVQLAFRNSLAKKGINIRGRIIDAGYVENIIAMLQNNSEKAYIIEPNEKIA